MVAAILITGPWLIALAWVLFRHGLSLDGSIPPSMSESAERRLSVR